MRRGQNAILLYHEKSILSYVACDETVNTQYDMEVILESRRNNNKHHMKKDGKSSVKKRRVAVV